MKTNEKVQDYECIAMACQGGGSLGAYHIGSLQAMQEADYQPDIVAGISIGAFTAAIIAGNEPEDRIAKLKEFWQTISWPDLPPCGEGFGFFKKWHNLLSSSQGFLFGQPGFFRPWSLPPFFQPGGTPGATSFYNTSLLRRTLPEVVDFKRINTKGKTRLLLGATRIRDGTPRWFDSEQDEIAPDHVMASGAMPPGFPGIRIEGDLYWDGGCYSNTPLDGIYGVKRHEDTLCFVIDLFGPNGREPQDIPEVNLTMKEIQFSSRITNHIQTVKDRHNFGHLLRHIKQQHPDVFEHHPHRDQIEELMAETRFDIMRICYEKPSYEVASCDCEFSKSSIQDRMLQGYRDMKRALQEKEQRDQQEKIGREEATVGSVVHTFSRGALVHTSFHTPQALLEELRKPARQVKRPGRAVQVESDTETAEHHREM